MRAKYIKPCINVSETAAISLLASSLQIDNDSEHDGWADAKPRNYEDSDTPPSEYGNLW